ALSLPAPLPPSPSGGRPRGYNRAPSRSPAMTEPVRLSKRLVELLGCSRREAELYIEGGWVTVAGELVDSPQFKVTDQAIELLPGAQPEDVPPATLLLHKPAGRGIDQALALLTRDNRWAEDDPAIRTVHKHLQRQQPVGL